MITKAEAIAAVKRARRIGVYVKLTDRVMPTVLVWADKEDMLSELEYLDDDALINVRLSKEDPDFVWVG